MRSMSCSRLPAIEGLSSYSSPNDELIKSMAAIKKDKSPDVSIVSEAAYWGTIHEDSIQKTGAEKLDCDIELSVREKVEAETLPLQGSLDGILTSRYEGAVIKTDPEKNIYVIGSDSVTLDGPGISESKLTMARPVLEPAPFRGPWQVQGLMLCTGYKWAAIFTLYQGVKLYTYVIPADEVMQGKIIEDVIDFQSRLDAWQETGEMEWYNPLNPNEAADTWSKPIGETVNLDKEATEIALKLLEAKKAQTAINKQIKEATTYLMTQMEGAENASVYENNEKIAHISWGMTPARKGFFTEAREATRSKSIKIKEV